MSVNDIVYIFVVLALLLAIIYVMLYFMKKFMFRFESGAKGTLPIKVVAMQGILPKKYVSVVKIKDDYYVLGVSENSITLIDKVDEEKYSDLLIEDEPSSGMNFGDLFKQKLKIK